MSGQRQQVNWVNGTTTTTNKYLNEIEQLQNRTALYNLSLILFKN